jgi:hypothetical protein
MKIDNFSIQNGDLVGFGRGRGQREYMVHFNIEMWHEQWEKEGIDINDFLDNKAYIETCIRNVSNGSPTRFIKKEA